MCIFMFLFDMFGIVGILGVWFFDYIVFDVKINEFFYFGNVFIIENVEFDFVEGGCYFVFYDFYVGLVVDDFVMIFDCIDMVNVEMDRGIEF